MSTHDYSRGKMNQNNVDNTTNVIASPGSTQYDEDHDAVMLITQTQGLDTESQGRSRSVHILGEGGNDVGNTSDSIGSLELGSRSRTRQFEWSFSQVFGERSPEEDVLEADMISAVEFDHTGDYLATGDHGGRVVLFERLGIEGGFEKNGTNDASVMDVRHIPRDDEFEYRYLTEFQSHDPEFDYLKSVEIEEKVNKIRWVRQWGDRRAHVLLTTNDKTIKLWKVYERKINQLVSYEEKTRAVLELPGIGSTQFQLSSKCRKVYPAGHAYHINSISLCSDQETFLSADDLRINLWHFDRPCLSFNIVDIKPEAMEDLTEVITCAEFHPTAPHIFAYGCSKGLTRLADMRAAALCDSHAKLFNGYESNSAERSFFSEIVASVNDVKFIGQEGNLLLTRDYLTMKVWDLRQESQPVYEHQVHSMLKSRLTQLYESDAIFDKFDCCASGDGSMIGTGTYSNFFRVNEADSNGNNFLLEASRDPNRRRLTMQSKLPNRIVGFGRPIQRSSSKSSLSMHKKTSNQKPDAPISDYVNKINHMDWHPGAPVIATAAQNSLYLYRGQEI
jgi:serine/threonine-protein phosphatase 2A regulatory subunit B